MIRYVDGWQLHGYVEHGVDGEIEPTITARHLAKNWFRLHRLTDSRFDSAGAAASYVDTRLFEVIGVENDGSLRF